jgi:hypothetical protein
LFTIFLKLLTGIDLQHAGIEVGIEEVRVNVEGFPMALQD